MQDCDRVCLVFQITVFAPSERKHRDLCRLCEKRTGPSRHGAGGKVVVVVSIYFVLLLLLLFLVLLLLLF